MSEQDNARQEMERLATARDEWRRTAYEITEQANKMRDNLIEERDIAKADFEKVVGYNTRLQDELDKARKEVEQWRWDYDRLSQLCSSKVEQVTKDHDKARAEFNRLTNERDEARAEVERLNRELEQAIAERTPHDYGILKDQRDDYRDRLCASIKETQEVRTEVEQLKQALHDARLENSGQAALIEQLKEKVDQLQYIADFDRKHFLKRPEPSRLEIAAMLLAGWLGNPDALSENNPHEWLLEADKLIAAAKGGAE